MKNTAEIHNDGVCVYFNSTVKVKKFAKAVLLFLNALTLWLWIFLISTIVEDDGSNGKAIMSIFVLFPAIYSFVLIRPTLWNMFGKEYIIINTKSITWRRDYGIFKTQWSVKQYRKLFYNIVIENEDLGLGIIEFTDHNQMDLPVTIFRSTVYVPQQQLKELVSQLDVVFSIEHLTKTGNDLIHLN